jgi:hypothetical protein
MKVHQDKSELFENRGAWKQRLMIGTPVTGLVRIEWVQRRYNQVIPTNWSLSEHLEFINSSMPLRFQVSDAQNLIVERVLREKFEWLWLIEQDNIIPVDAFIKINQYMLDKKYPVVSGLYFTKSIPPEPIVYKGRGNSFFKDWKMGTKFFVDGVPTGCILIHSSLLKAIWDESPEYTVGNRLTRRVFEEPARIVYKKELHTWMGEVGTSDLEFCTRVMKGKFLTKAGWPKFDKMESPFLVDTGLFCQHIDETGRQFPLGGIPAEYQETKEKRVRNKNK